MRGKKKTKRKRKSAVAQLAKDTNPSPSNEAEVKEIDQTSFENGEVRAALKPEKNVADNIISGKPLSDASPEKKAKGGRRDRGRKSIGTAASSNEIQGPSESFLNHS